MSRRLICLLFVSFLASGCALTQSHLDVGVNQDDIARGPLSSVEATTFNVEEFEDARRDQTRIGFKRNGFGQEMADIKTTRPVAVIVHDAVEAALQKNGHLLKTEGNVFTISGTVTEFWFEMNIHFWTVEFVGSIVTEFQFHDGGSGELILTRKYEGFYREESLGGLDGTWEKVMELALSDMIRKASTDPELVKVLTAHAAE